MSTRARRDGYTSGPRGGLHAIAARGRVALRIARRTSLRSLSQSTLIASMVALPVAGLAAAGLVGMSTTPTVTESMTVKLGQTQARVQMMSPPDPSLTQDPLEPYGWNVDRDANGNPLNSTSEDVIVHPSSIFPNGTRILPIVDGMSLTAETKDGVAAFPATEGPAWDPSFAGRYDVVGGRAPRVSNEVMVTPSTLARLGVTLGGTVQLLAPSDLAATVVGLLDDQTAPDSDQAFFTQPGVLSGDSDRLQQTTFYLPDTSLTWSQVQDVNVHGATVLSREVLNNPPAPESIRLGVSGSSLNPSWALVAAIAGFAFFEVALLAGAAFMVGARQQQRSLATVASVGANRTTLFSIVTSSGLVLGLIGGLAGIGLGIVGGSLFMRLTDNGSATQYWGYHLSWPLMAAILAFAMVVGWLAAIVPAVNTSRFDVVSALRGARKPAPPSRRKPIAGLIVLLAGVAMSLAGGTAIVVLSASSSFGTDSALTWVVITMMVVGPIAAQFGLVLCSALLLRAAARLLGRVNIGARLASRDAARNTGRSVPALTAIMTTVFTAVFGMTMISSVELESRDSYQYHSMPGQVSVGLDYWDQTTQTRMAYDTPTDIVDVLRATLNADGVRVITSVPENRGGPQTQSFSDSVTRTPTLTVPAPNRCPSDTVYSNTSDVRCKASFVNQYGGGNHIVVGNAQDLALVLGKDPTPAALQALASGKVVSLYPAYVNDGKISLAWWSSTQWQDGTASNPTTAPVRTETVPAVVEHPDHGVQFGVFISPATEEKYGIPSEPSTVLAAASTSTPPTDQQLDSIRQQLAVLAGGNQNALYAQVETGPNQFAGLVAWALLGLSALVAIASSAVAIGLARFDGRQDDATLASIGSSPLIRRNFAFWQGLVLAGIGTVLGAAIGLIPAVAFTVPGSSLPFAAPWLQIGITVTALPLLIACGSWLLAPRNRVQARRITMG